VTRRQALLAIAAVHAPGEALFDGSGLKRFRTVTGLTGPEASWVVRDGAVESIPDARRQCDLLTVDEYEEFDLEFEWKVGPGANTGVKYLIQATATDRLRDAQGEFLHETTLGFELQLIDDAAVEDGNPKHVTGALYNYLAPSGRAARPAGEWNAGRLVVRGGGAEHWINGRRVLAYSFDSPELRAALAARRVNSARMLERLARRKTPVSFQHHESWVAFRHIRIRS
jgi:hypothetical protein